MAEEESVGRVLRLPWAHAVGGWLRVRLRDTRRPLGVAALATTGRGAPLPGVGLERLSLAALLRGRRRTLLDFEGLAQIAEDLATRRRDARPARGVAINVRIF